jgi:hypothetical protein
MWTYVVIILKVGFENLPELPFIENDHLIQAFKPNRTHQPLEVGALPRGSRGDQLLLDACQGSPLTPCPNVPCHSDPTGECAWRKHTRFR